MAPTSSVAIPVMSGSSDSPLSPAQSVLLTMCEGNEPSPVSPEDAGTAGSVGTACSGLTFANAVLCLNVTTRQWLECGQREVGRMALGCHGRVAIEAIQGDLGWSTFEVREARSKATYEGRLRLMDDERWPRRLFRYASLTGTQTQWCRRLGNLKRKFGMSAKPVVEDRMYKWAHAVKTQVCEEETEQWRRAMENKSPLLTYRTHKADIGTEPLYDNSGGSALLFEARAGALRTLT
ncbi:hypothetical protein HPB50_019583 [Hyalomma asiaticum]|uniref:Uncharacterized protein n=1 Tax=Hyalomma asiaticum TaxID=266040 RepID=A0ACB7TIY2_HYAAI|nr:hypothetical protein HPB50_019583 [Hyalomma asiaticum]